MKGGHDRYYAKQLIAFFTLSFLIDVVHEFQCDFLPRHQLYTDRIFICLTNQAYGSSRSLLNIVYRFACPQCWKKVLVWFRFVILT